MNNTLQYSSYDIIEVCLLAGKVMLQSGAETYRVEDTMSRIAAAYGILHSHSYVTPTGIIFSMDGTEPAKLIRIVERTTDLHKVVEVNNISRRISAGELSPRQATEQLRQVENGPPAYSRWVQLFSAAAASGCFMIMFQGIWPDFPAAFICGAIGFAAVQYFHRLVQVRFFAEFSAAFLVGLAASLFVTIGFGHQLDTIVIGSVMPLVPGLLITNAIRDLMAGHLVSGLSKGADAFLTSFAIGAGVAVIFSIWWSGGML
ncbi:threonine/serine exporter family protein [Paenibacillus sp. P96]|uniref:Threonine/serine exporter family protein n=1 Tax=Paenibacillus zeirhizosphaerae TaxID=2987519 RepID=A0ABT9FKR6_9BACL|nr:threonine/serine exporter family protein [Paenibacillus sp. P96]MDP4095320.1 threonine/serine exporter family protein [Paenibacillus sp. P96]